MNRNDKLTQMSFDLDKIICDHLKSEINDGKITNSEAHFIAMASHMSGFASFLRCAVDLEANWRKTLNDIFQQIEKELTRYEESKQCKH